MEYSTYLTTMAQIAGVIVGFANLINAISRPDLSDSDLEVNKIRIILTTELGLFLVSLCVLPLLFSASNYSEINIIRGLSFAFLLLSVVYQLANLIRVKRTTGKYLPTKLAPFMHIGNVVFIMIPFSLNSLGLFGTENTILVYCLQTFYLFTLICVLFSRLLYSLLPKTHL